MSSLYFWLDIFFQFEARVKELDEVYTSTGERLHVARVKELDEVYTSTGERLHV
jgi:hypothetical protein